MDRRTPLATATLVVAANAPDVDILSYAGGTYFALAFRRGITHGIPAQIVLPFVVAGAMLAWDRWVRRRRLPEEAPALPREILLLSFVGVFTHPVLDWMNVYGMRWGLPFTGSWSYGDALFIIDPWLWLLLGSAVFLARSGGAVLWAVLAVLTTLLMWVGPLPRTASVVWTVALVTIALLRWKGWPAVEVGMARWARGAVCASVAYIA
ncbi:MAG TPA: metal-dependent hydrolase, partial [Longimicrobiales bacterium]|nr:metal-dependent hydrolase [Longimicrobiales bacterium]